MVADISRRPGAACGPLGHRAICDLRSAICSCLLPIEMLFHSLYTYRMTRMFRRQAKKPPAFCHCDERSDAAISRATATTIELRINADKPFRDTDLRGFTRIRIIDHQCQGPDLQERP